MDGYDLLDIRPEVDAALRDGRPVVALESTLIAHGLPWPVNLETAQRAEAAIRDEGAVPATIAVIEGRPAIGLSADELEALARARGVLKASRRDLSIALTRRRTAATTVAATMFLAHLAGIRLFATGGIGGAHRDATQPWDVSADLIELARTPVCVVCAGAKSILDIPRTLEILETQGVPVAGYGTDEFPAFYMHSSREPVSVRVDSPAEAARLLATHWQLQGAGVVLAQPTEEGESLDADEFARVLAEVEGRAVSRGIRGKDLTPFLLSEISEATGGRTLSVNQTLVTANARLAARVAREYSRLTSPVYV